MKLKTVKYFLSNVIREPSFLAMIGIVSIAVASPIVGRMQVPGENFAMQMFTGIATTVLVIAITIAVVAASIGLYTLWIEVWDNMKSIWSDAKFKEEIDEQKSKPQHVSGDGVSRRT